MSTTEIVLICVGGVLGYVALGALMAAVVAAIDTRRFSDGRPYGVVTALAGIVWPVVALGFVAYWTGRPVGRGWLRLIRKLNPNFVGFD